MSNIEFLVILVMMFILAPILLLPRSGSRKALRPQCLANMKQVALGYILWVQDSEKSNLPFRVDYKDGGLKNPAGNIDLGIPGVPPQPADLRSNAWLQFAYIYKELNDPKVLLCPADRDGTRKVPFSWTMNPDGGFCNPAYQNKAISYCINLDAGLLSPDGKSLDLAKSQTQVLLSERHMEYDTVNSACSANVGLTKAIKLTRQSATNALVTMGWKNRKPRLHKDGGNVALLDGSAHQVTTKQMQDLLGQNDDNGELHFIYP